MNTKEVSQADSSTSPEETIFAPADLSELDGIQPSQDQLIICK